MDTGNRIPRWHRMILTAGMATMLTTCISCSSQTTTMRQAMATTAPAPAEPLRCEVIDPGFLESDCSYHGVYIDNRNQVYFTLSAHSPVTWSRLYHFDPQTRKVDWLFNPQTVTPETGFVAHGKVHSPIAEYKGELFFATHSGYYKTSHKLPGSNKTIEPYRGSYVYAVNKDNGKARLVAEPLHNHPLTVPLDKGVPMSGEGLISTVMDTQRGLFYGLSWPSGIFVKVDVATGKVTEYGKMQDGGEAVPQNLAEAPAATAPATRKATTKTKNSDKPNPHYSQICRTLGLDDQGNVYGSSGYGGIWKYDRQQDKIVAMKADCRNATAATDRKYSPWLDMWRAIVWDDTEKVFYGVHWGSSWLFRFDPRADTIQPIIHWAPAGGKVADNAQLGLTMGPRHTLYGLVHAPALKKNVQRSVHLITLNLDSMQLKDHGYILGDNDMTVMFAETCRVASNGDVYSSCWVEVPADRLDEVKAKRKEGGVPEVKYPFVMSLIRIPAERITRDAPSAVNR